MKKSYLYIVIAILFILLLSVTYFLYQKTTSQKLAEVQSAKEKLINDIKPAKDAILALKKVEAKTETGISYNDYIKILGDTQFYIKLFLESKDSKELFKPVAEHIIKAMLYYATAIKIWDIKFSKKSDMYNNNLLFTDIKDLGYPFNIWTSKNIELLLSLYPNAKTIKGQDYFGEIREAYSIQDVLNQIWKDASNEIDSASNEIEEIECKAKNN